MTKEQKNAIWKLRKEGTGYTKIADALGISVNTISSFCRRNKITVTETKPKSESPSHFCHQCGMPIEQAPGRKEKKFCSDACRNRWWNAHLSQVNRKAFYEITCEGCGKIFESYGNKNRKYCSHACYIRTRFGGDENE